MAEIWEFGNTGSDMSQQERVLIQLANHVTQQANLLPDTVLNGGDLTKMTQAQFLATITGRRMDAILSGFGATEGLAFTAPSLSFQDISVGKIQILKKAGEIVKKAGNAIKDAFSKLVNWIFKGPLQKASEFFLYSFITKPMSATIERKKSVQLAIVDFIAKATGSKRETVLATIAAAITQKHGKTPAQILNAASNGQIAGFGAITAAAAIAAISTIKEIIEKVVTFFKKKKEETPKVETTDAPDLNELETPAGTPPIVPVVNVPDAQGNPVAVPITTAPIKDSNELVPIPTPPVRQEGEPIVDKLPELPNKTPQKKEESNTGLLIGAVIVAALLLNR